MSTPSVSEMYPAAAISAVYVSLLQQRGPPRNPTASRHLDVIMLHLPQDSPDSGVEPAIIL